MPQNYSQFFELQNIMTQLVVCLNDLAPELEVGQLAAALSERVTDNLNQLTPILAGLPSVDGRDSFGTNPSLQNERYSYYRIGSDVWNSFNTKLVPDAKKLQASLKVKPGSEATAEQLRQILNAAEKLTASWINMSPSSSSSTMGEVRGDIRSSTASRPRDVDEPAEAAVVRVQRKYLDDLQSHQGKLDNYVKSYIAARELDELCNRTLSSLGRAKGKPPSGESYESEYWEDIKNSLEKAILDVISLSDFNDMFIEFRTHLDEVKEETQKAIGSVNDQDFAPAGFARRAYDAMSQAANTLYNIARQCENGANSELTKVNTCLDMIFDQVPVKETNPVAGSKREGSTAVSVEVGQTIGSERVSRSQGAETAPEKASLSTRGHVGA